MILSLLALDDNMSPLWSLGRGILMNMELVGAVGGWLEGLLEVAIVYDRFIHVSRILHVYDRMEHPWGPYDPTLVLMLQSIRKYIIHQASVIHSSQAQKLA